MPLRDAILIGKPDRGGARGAKGYDYQRDWAFCCLLELHGESREFLMLLDYHDDVVVLNSSMDPDQATLYQVKSRDDRPWTVAELLDPGPAGKKPRSHGTPKDGGGSPPAGPIPIILSPTAAPTGKSVLGKMYANVARLAGFDVHLCLVSNQRLNVTLEDGGNALQHLRLGCPQLRKSDRTRMSNAIRKELDLTAAPELDAILRFECVDLSPHDSALHATGRLGEFLQVNSLGRNPSAHDIYDRIMRELRRKNNYHWTVTDFDELKRKKGISDREFREMLIAGASHKNAVERWASMRTCLANEGLAMGRLLVLENAWDRYAALRTDPRDLIVGWLRERAAEFVDPYVAEPERLQALRPFMELGRAELRAGLDAEYVKFAAAGSDFYVPKEAEIEAALLYELTDEQESRQLQAAYPQLAKEAE